MSKHNFIALQDILNPRNGKKARKSFSSIRPKKDSKSSFSFIYLTQAWSTIIGSNMAKHSLPLRIQNSTLHILSNHSAFSSALSFMEQEIIKKIEGKFPDLKNKIKKIRFEVNSSFFEKKQTESIKRLKKNTNQIHKFSPEHKSLSLEADSLLNEITEDKLREQLTSIFFQLRQNKNRGQ